MDVNQYIFSRIYRDITYLYIMSTIIFDTETTGLPRSKYGLITDDSNWPYIVQLAWIIVNKNGIVKTQNYIIKLPAGVSISAEVTKIHGISNKMMREEGISASIGFREFIDDMNKSTFFVAHNIAFDTKILRAELYRHKMFSEINMIDRKKKYCTMKHGTDICKIKHSTYDKWKWPTLVELHWVLFGQELQESQLHNAFVDVLICLRCYWKMKYGEDFINDDFNKLFSIVKA